MHRCTSNIALADHFTNMLHTLGALLVLTSALSNFTVTPLGKHDLTGAAQLNVVQLATGKTLFVTQFSAFGSSGLSYLAKPEKALAAFDSADFESLVPTVDLLWPNSAIKVPEAILPNAILVADGFLVPQKDDGGIYLIQIDAELKVKNSVCLTKVKSGFFYHYAEFVDVDGDGLLDIVTARAEKGIFESGAELLWLKNPGTVSGAWTETVVTAGPDVMFRIHELDGNPKTLDIVAAQFFSSELKAYFIDRSSSQVVQSITIDENVGAAYDLHFVDVNADGKLDLLVSNHGIFNTTCLTLT